MSGGTQLLFSEAINRERFAKEICAELNNFTELQSSLKTVILRIKELTFCRSIGIRLHHEKDYPYYVWDGFAEKFILKENSLCSRDAVGNPIEAEDGQSYELDCMCGNVIRGRFDSTLPFFTKKGSFWSNGTTELLATSTEDDRQSRTRNHCNASGYESVALIPIKKRTERVGLLQCNDYRKDMFTLELIEFLEMICEQIGLAVYNSMAYEDLRKAKEEIKVLKGILPICSICKKVRTDDGGWENIDAFVAKRTEADFSHGFCPKCYEEYSGKILGE